MAKRIRIKKEQYPASKKWRYILVSLPDMLELQEFANFRQACDEGSHRFATGTNGMHSMHGVLWNVTRKPREVEAPQVDERDTYLLARPSQAARLYR